MWPALVAGFFFSGAAQAEEIPRYILIQTLSHVREVCAHVEVPDWGCVTFGGATDDPTVRYCYMHVPRLHDRPWDQEALIEALRPLCENTEEAGN